MTQHRHLIQFYGTDEGRLVKNVGGFCFDRLKDGSCALIIADPARSEAIVREIEGLTRERAVARTAPERIIVLDAEATLAEFTSAGWPDPELFERRIGARVRDLYDRGGRFPVYGEMVGLLWAKGRTDAAIALEDLWSHLLASVPFQLFYGYPIDVLAPEFQIGRIDPLLSAHTGVAAATAAPLDTAVRHAIDEVLGPSLNGLRPIGPKLRRPSWPALPPAEQKVLWLRNNVPRHAEEILSRVRACRAS